MFNPKVSIIIPVYNGSNYLAEAIESALNQTYNNIEILVINDGSTDNGETEKVALSFADKIKYIKKENGGVSTTLNLGIEKMTGEYFSWLSHDDLYSTNKIQEQIDFLNTLENKNTILSCDFEFINEKGEFIGNSNIKKSDYESILYSIFIRKYPIYGCALLIPKQILNEIGFFDNKMKCTQDYDYWLRILENGYDFNYIDKILTQYRRHSEQGTNEKGNLYNKCIKEEFLLYSKYLYKIGIFRIIKDGNENLIKSILKVIIPIIYSLFYIIFRKFKSIK